MGRNAIPKLGEWRDGHLYDFHSVDPFRPRKNWEPPTPDNGKMIVYECTQKSQNSNEDEVTVLGVAYADGFLECMASMWHSGFRKGEQAGYEKAKRELRASLGIKESADG